MQIYCSKSEFSSRKDIFKNVVDDYNKNFEFYLIFCKWKLHFSDTIINVKTDGLYNIHRAGWNLRRNLMSKIEYFESNGHKFSHISEIYCFYNRFEEYDI